MGISNIAVNLIGNDNLSGAVSKAAAAVSGLSVSLGRANRNLSESFVIANAFEKQVYDMSQAMIIGATVANAMAQSIDRVGDQALVTTAQLGLLGALSESFAGSFGGLSVNVGMFTISLQDFQTQIPLLITTIGTAITVIGGLTAALAAASVAITSIMTAGFLGFLEGIEERFSDVNSTAEAMQKLFTPLREMFMDALDPLVTQENIELVITSLESLMRFINRTAQAIAQFRDAYVDFFVNLGVEFDRLATSINNMFVFDPDTQAIDSAGEALFNFIDYILTSLPYALDFFNDTITKLGEPLSGLFDSIIELTKALINMVEMIGDEVIGIIRIFADFLTTLTRIFNVLGGPVISSVVVQLLGLAVAFYGIVRIFNSFLQKAGIITRWFNETTQGAITLKGKIDSLAAAFFGWFDKTFPELESYLQQFRSGIPVIGKFADIYAQTFKNVIGTRIPGAGGEFFRDSADQILRVNYDLIDTLDEIKGLDPARLISTRSFSELKQMFGDDIDIGVDEFGARVRGVSAATDMFRKKTSSMLGVLTDKYNDFFRIQRRGLGLFSTQVRGGIIAPLEKLEVLSPRVMDTLDFRTVRPKNVEGIFNRILKSTVAARASGQTTLKDFERFGQVANEIVSEMNLMPVTGFIPSMRTAKVWVKTNESVLTQFKNLVTSSIGSARKQLFSYGAALKSVGRQLTDVAAINMAMATAVGEAGAAVVGTFDDIGRAAVGAFNAIVSEALFAGGAIRSALNKPIVDVLRHYDVQLYALRKRLSAAIVDIAGLPFAAIGKAVSGPIVNTASAAMEQFNRRIIQGVGLVDGDLVRRQLFKELRGGFAFPDMGFGLPSSVDYMFTQARAKAILDPDTLFPFEAMHVQFRALGDFIETQFLSMFVGPGEKIASVFTDLGGFAARSFQTLNKHLSYTSSLIGVSISRSLRNMRKQAESVGRLFPSIFGGPEIFQQTRKGIETVKSGLSGLRNIVTAGVIPAFQRLRKTAETALVTTGLSIESARNRVAAFLVAIGDGLGLSDLSLSFDSVKSSVRSFTRSLYDAIVGKKIMKTVDMGIVKTNGLLTFSYLQQQVAAFKAFAANEGLAAALMHVGKTATFAYLNMLKFAASQLYTIVTGISLSGIMNLLTLQATALNGALGGLPLLLGAIVTAGAAMVGIIGQGEGPVVNLRNGFNRLKEGLFAIIGVLVDIFVPIWNLFLDIVELLLSPIFALYDGFKLILDALIPVNEQGDKVGESFSLLSWLIGNFTTVLGIAGKVLDFFSDVVYYSILVPFQLIASVIRFVINGLYDLYNVIRSSSVVQGALAGLRDIFQGIANFVDAIFTRLIDGINNIARKLNRLPFVDIGTIGEESRGASQALSGARVTTTQTMENISGDTAPPGEDAQTKTQKTEFNFNEYIENNTNVDAQPEDKQRIKGLVESALKDANTYRRQRDGRSG